MKRSAINLKPADSIVLVAVLIVALGSYFIFLPQTQALTDKRQILGEKIAQRAKLDADYQALNDFSNALPQYQQPVKQLGVAYPTEPELAEALIQTKTMAEKSGLAITSVNPAQVNAGALPVTMTAKGNYGAVDTFLRNLAANLRPVWVRSLAIVDDPDKTKDLVTMTAALQFEYNALTNPNNSSSPVPSP